MFKYDFLCPECESVTEGVVKSSTQKIHVCAECGCLARRTICGGIRTKRGTGIATTNWYEGDTGPGGRWEDISYTERIHIRNKADLVELCERKQLYERKNGGPDQNRGPVVLLNGGR